MSTKTTPRRICWLRLRVWPKTVRTSELCLANRWNPNGRVAIGSDVLRAVPSVTRLRPLLFPRVKVQDLSSWGGSAVRILGSPPPPMEWLSNDSTFKDAKDFDVACSL